MKIFDLILTALSNLFKRKTRTLLTLLGVILGAASVTLTFAIGDAVKANSEAILQSSTILKIIYIYTNPNNNKSNNSGPYLDDKLIAKLKQIDGIQSLIYSLDVGNNVGILAGKKDRYQSFNSVSGINFEDIEKAGLNLIDNKDIPPNNYQFHLTNKTIRIVGGEFFEYMFQDQSKMNKRPKRGRGGPGGGRRRISSASRMENSPAEQYMYSKWDPDYKPEILPPFVDASKENIDLVIRYPNTSSSSNHLSEYDINYDPNQSATTDNDKYKYRRYKLDLYGRYDWNTVKDDDLLCQAASAGVYVDIDTAKTLIRESRRLNKDSEKTSPEFQYQSIIIIAKSIDYVENITKEVKKMNYKTYNLTEQIKNEQLRTQSNQFILGFLGALALIVSAISIANTMVTSVYERTKEIGIMKVLGCKIGNIQFMFLLESIIIGFSGGVIGVSISYLFSNFMNNLILNQTENSGFFTNIISQYLEAMKSGMMNYLGNGAAMKIAVINPQLLVLVILGTTLIGFLAGYFPALAASKISALKAIKTGK